MGAAAGSFNLGYSCPSTDPQEPTRQLVMDQVFFLSEGGADLAKLSPGAI